MKKKEIEEILSDLEDSERELLESKLRECDTPEEFISGVMVGECPKCSSLTTKDCEDEPEVDDITIGKCLMCGHLWCLECGEDFKEGQRRCEHWSVCLECEVNDEFGCGIPIWECSAIQKWREGRENQ